MSEQLDRLIQTLRQYCSGGIVLGFSGGTDSALLLAVLSRLRKEKEYPLAAVMMRSAFQLDQECTEAEFLAQQFQVPFFLLDYDPLSLPEIRHNVPDRCYFCKKHFFSKILSFARKKGIGYVLDGTNRDDLTKYRPGLKAVQELGIKSPLAESGLSKAEIRAISRELELPTAEKPAAPCLATRFDYGMKLSEEKIRNVGKGEAIIRKFLPEAKEIRLRQENDGVRIEVSSAVLPDLMNCREAVFRELSRLGFSGITIDPRGYRSGSFDQFPHLRLKNPEMAVTVQQIKQESGL